MEPFQVRSKAHGEEHEPSMIEKSILGGLALLGVLCLLIMATYQRLVRFWFEPEKEDPKEGQ